MKTVIYLSNQTVKAVTGQIRRGKIYISAAYQEDAPRLSIVNGQVTDDKAFTEFLRSFWTKYKLSGHSVCLVINSTQTVVRFFDLPPMPHRKRMRYLPREFSDVERMRDPVYSYGLAGKGRRPEENKLFGAVMEREFLGEHLRRFRSLGIRITSVETALTTQLRLLSCLEELKGKVCAVQILDGTALLGILWVNDTFLHFNRTRIPPQADARSTGEICAQNVSVLMQFARTQKIRQEIEAVYMGGLKKENWDEYTAALFSVSSGLRVHSLTDCTGSAVSFPEGADELGNFMAVIGGLLSNGGRANLLYQFRRSPEFLARRKRLLHRLTPALLAAAVMSFVVGIQAVRWFQLVNRINRGLDYLSDSQVLAGVARYDHLEEENQKLLRRIEETNRILENIYSYPVMSTKIDQVVARCADGLVSADIISFQADPGVIQVSSLAESERLIYPFIDRLAEEKEVFSSIHYTGFEYVESQQAWRLYVECHLNAGAGKEQKP